MGDSRFRKIRLSYRFRNISYIVISIVERARPAPAPARPARGQRAWDLGELILLAVLRQVLRPLISSRFFMRIKYTISSSVTRTLRSSRRRRRATEGEPSQRTCICTLCA